MQYGIPVVATAQGGALEMIAENETGIFIPLNNLTTAVYKIQELLNTEKYLIMGVAAQQREKHFFSNLVYEQKISSLINSL
jgi:glycosyltransferase involved in cell wall biosynthesis